MKPKKKILFIVKNKHEASSRFRVFAYLNALKKDFETTVFYSEYNNNKIPKLFRSFIKRVRFLTLLPLANRHDIIFMQRPMSSDKSLSTFFERLLTTINPRLIFDFDDALFVQNPKKIDALIRLSRACICGNEFLADYTKKLNSRTVLIPTAINTDKFQPKAEDTPGTLTIGWTGTSGNYTFFSQALKKALKEIVHENTDTRFLFICDRKPDESFDFAYDFIPWNAETEVADLHNIDIGLMPLEESDWTRGKCGFKLIQYGAIGIPSIGSNVGVNSKVIIDGESGYLVENENWYALLNTLIHDEKIRRSMGHKAREYIVEHYSIRNNYPKLKEAITSVLD